MSITNEKKQKLMQDFARTSGDTGSPEVQCAILTERIKNLTEHFKINKHDFQSRKGLLALVNRRKRLLRYLESKDLNRYQQVKHKLGLRK